MYVKEVIETPEGKVSFEGVLTQKELQAVVSVGLNVLLRTGAIVQTEKPEDATVN